MGLSFFVNHIIYCTRILTDTYLQAVCLKWYHHTLICLLSQLIHAWYLHLLFTESWSTTKMASPSLQSMCCLFLNESQIQNKSDNIDWQTVIYTYDVLCVISSSLSICGATYQLIPRSPKTIPRTKKEVESFIRQNIVICWLAVADLLASIGMDPDNYFFL